MENRVSFTNKNHPTFSNTHQITSHRDSVFTNISNTFQRSQISTSKSKGHYSNNKQCYHYSRSKIKTLPNYKPQNLSGAMPFVAVFQCIQIQRLSEQIEVQRARLNQAQKQAFNAINYEVQIQELSQKCANNQAQIKQYQAQLNKMNKICESLYHQNQNHKNGIKQQFFETSSYGSSMKSITTKKQLLQIRKQLENKDQKIKKLEKQAQKWQSKYHQIDQNRQHQLEQMKQFMDNQRKSVLNRQIKDLQAKHQAQCNNLNMEIKRLNQELNFKESQIQDMRVKAKNADDYIKQLQQYGQKLSEYENKISLLNNQHMRLSQIVDNSSVQLNSARKKQFQLTKQLTTDREIILDNQYLKQILQTKQKQIQNWKNSLSNLQEQISKGKQLYLINQQLQAKNAFLKQQNIKANTTIREKQSQIQKYKKNNSEVQKQLSKLKTYQLQNTDTENREKMLKIQNQRIGNLLKIKTQELQEIKQKWRKADSDIINMSRLQKQVKMCEQKYRAQVQRNQNLQNYIQELENVRNMSGTCQIKNQQLSQKLKYSEKQCQNLKKTLSNLQSQLIHSRKTDAKTSSDELMLKKHQLLYKQKEDKINLLGSQIQRLNNLLQQKNLAITKLQSQQLQSFRLKNQYKKIEIQLQDKDKEIECLRQQLDNSWNRNKQYETEMLEAQHNNKQRINQITKKDRYLQESLMKKTEQYEVLRQKYDQLQKQANQSANAQKLCQKQQNRITVYLRDIDSLKKQKQQLTKLVDQFKNQIYQQKQAISNLEHKLRMGQLSASQIKSRTSQQSNGKYSSNFFSLKKTKSNVQSDPEQLVKKINQLQDIVADLKTKYTILLSSVQSAASRSNISRYSSSESQEGNQDGIQISRVSSFAKY